jgi:hypothetical protein
MEADWGRASTTQNISTSVAGSQQNLGARHGTDSPSAPPEETNFAGTLALDLLPPEL